MCIPVCACVCHLCVCLQRSQIKQLEGEVFRGHFPFAGHRKTNIMVTNRCVPPPSSSPHHLPVLLDHVVFPFCFRDDFLFQSLISPPWHVCNKTQCLLLRSLNCVRCLYFIFIPFAFYRSAFLCCWFSSAVFVQEDFVCERDRFCRPF